jgi:sugar phosphate isomerase/epimerase
VQLYTLRAHTATDMLGTLRQVAAIGYRAVEFAGYGDQTASTIRPTLDELGLKAPAAHVPFHQFESNLAAVVNDMHTLGCHHVVVPSIPTEERADAAQVQQLAQRLNRIGQQVADEGLRLGYHNHAFEFAPLDGSTMWELLVENTDPALVDFELDVFWAVVGGFDPLDLLGRHGARVALVHLKDQSRDPGGSDAPVGDGQLPWDTILPAAAQNTAAQLYIVEQDHPRDPLNDVARSFQYLQRRVNDAA